MGTESRLRAGSGNAELTAEALRASGLASPREMRRGETELSAPAAALSDSAPGAGWGDLFQGLAEERFTLALPFLSAGGAWRFLGDAERREGACEAGLSDSHVARSFSAGRVKAVPGGSRAGRGGGRGRRQRREQARGTHRGRLGTSQALSVANQ